MEENRQTNASRFSLTNQQSQLLRARNMVLIGMLFLFTLTTAADSASRATSTAASALQASINGQWTAEYRKDKPERAEKLHLTLYRQRDGVKSQTMGFDMSLAELQGLTLEQVSASQSNVRFRLAREAGTFDFEGAFREGKGAGHWTLAPSQQFVAEMRERGFDNLSEEKLVSAAMLDVRTKAIDDLKAIGYSLSSIEDVFKVTIFKVTPELVRELQSLGFENLDLEDLVKARIFKITPEFAREVQAMGFRNESLESLVKLRIFKITSEFAREMRDAGLSNLSLEDLVKLRIHKIDTSFIQRVKASGRTDLDVEELIRLRIHGVVR